MAITKVDLDEKQKKYKNANNEIPKKDIDTTSNVMKNYQNRNQGFFGRRKIKIPVEKEDFYIDPLKYFKKYLNYIEETHELNVNEIKYLDDCFKGKQEILFKTRPNGDTKINNISVTNFFIEWNAFKKGYYIGKPIKYVDINGADFDYDDMKYFNLYMRDINKASKDMIKYEKLFTNGIAHTMVAYKSEDVETDKNCPFEYTILDNENVCCVYSNDVKQTKLFSLYISEMKDDEGKTYRVYSIYFKNRLLVVKKDETKSIGFKILKDEELKVYDCITEYTLNEQRMSIIEMALSGVNTINKIRSMQLDQQEEHVNNYIVFINVDTGKIDSEKMRQKRILGISSNGNKNADVKTISCDIDFTSLNEFVQEVIQDMFDIVGVPRATSNTGQGVSGEAQTYGGGWENAYNIAKVDTTYIMQYEREDLNKFINLCQNYINDKIPNLFTNGIEIKYTLNKSNNMMVKAQSLKYFIDEGFTREQALTYCEITDDPQNDGRIADENAKMIEERNFQLEIEKDMKLSEISQNDNSNENNQE